MGREESKEQSKAAQREKEEAAHARKQANRDKQWEKGAKDTSKDDASAAKAAADQARRDAVRAQLEAEGSTASAGAQPPATKKCKECGHKMTPKEQKRGCPKCIEILLGGGATAKGKGKK